MQDFQARAETVQENWNSYLSYDNTKLYIKIIHLLSTAQTTQYIPINKSNILFLILHGWRKLNTTLCRT